MQPQSAWWTIRSPENRIIGKTLLTRIDLDEEFHFGLFLKIYAVDASTSRRSVFSEELGGV
jgi:hypothetical protein